MSYANGGYNRVGGYGQGNPYDQRRDEYDPNGYNSGGYNQQGDVEMQNINTGYGGADAILNACRDIDGSIDEIEQQMQQLENLYRRAANAPDQYSGQIDTLSSNIMSGYRQLVDRVKKIKSQPESRSPRNQGQVGRLDRRLKATINKYQNMERDYRRDIRAQAERQFRIVKPDATQEEVRQATENPDAPIFQQALMQSDRRGQATSVLNNVRARHEEILRIEQQMVELAQLFQDLDQIVMEQGEVVNQIETKAEETTDHVIKANEQIDQALVSARGARRKKWWCLLIAVIIVIIIAIVVAVVVTVLNNQKGP